MKNHTTSLDDDEKLHPFRHGGKKSGHRTTKKKKLFHPFGLLNNHVAPKKLTVTKMISNRLNHFTPLRNESTLAFGIMLQRRR